MAMEVDIFRDKRVESHGSREKIPVSVDIGQIQELERVDGTYTRR